MQLKRKEYDEIALPPSSALKEPAAVLQAIVKLVEEHGPQGHWLSRSSPIVAAARIALLNDGIDGKDTVLLESALRDLVWRAEHVRQQLDASPHVELRDLIGLLDVSDARKALGLPPADVDLDRQES